MKNIVEIISELQSNPKNLQAYRKLIKFYYSCGKKDEAEAFQYLIEKKYGSNSSDNHEKQ